MTTNNSVGKVQWTPATKENEFVNEMWELFDDSEGKPQDSYNVSFEAMDCFFRNVFRSMQQPLSPQSADDGFIIREFDSNKYYWCKCEVCGWEDSSEYLEGCSPIGETGDYTDPFCPVCGCNKIEGDAELSVPDGYSGVHKIKIPIDLILKPYKKTVKNLDAALEKYRWPSVPQSAEGVEEMTKEAILAKYKYRLGTQHMDLFKGIIYAAMTEYSSLMNKEKDREIMRLKDLLQEVCVRANIILPEREEDIDRFDEMFCHQKELMLNIAATLGLGEIDDESKLWNEKHLKIVQQNFKP